MSFGIAKRLKKLLGYGSDMKLEAPWLNGADSENSGFSNKDLADTPQYLQGADDDQFISSETHFIKADIKKPQAHQNQAVEQPRTEQQTAKVDYSNYDQQREQRQRDAMAARNADNTNVGRTQNEGNGAYNQSDRSTAGRRSTS